MPKSKRPRKKYRPKARLISQGIGVMNDFFFRRESWDTDDWQLAVRLHLITPFNQILEGEAEEHTWAQAKTNLVEGWATAGQFEETDRIRREIKAANSMLRVAYNHWLKDGSILERNVEAARDACQLIIDMWQTMNPGEVTQGCRNLGRDPKAMTRIEIEMDGRTASSI